MLERGLAPRQTPPGRLPEEMRSRSLAGPAGETLFSFRRFVRRLVAAGAGDQTALAAGVHRKLSVSRK